MKKKRGQRRSGVGLKIKFIPGWLEKLWLKC